MGSDALKSWCDYKAHPVEEGSGVFLTSWVFLKGLCTVWKIFKIVVKMGRLCVTFTGMSTLSLRKEEIMFLLLL